MLQNFLTLLFLSLSLYAKSANVTLALPWKHQFQFAGYYMAQEKGFYQTSHLNVTIKEFDLKDENAKDVASGKYEFGVGHSSLILDKLNNYPDIKFLAAIHQSSPLILLSRKRDDIKSIEDISGKTVMMSSDQTFSASIKAMLFSNKSTQNDYNIVDTSFDVTDIINGNADFMIAYSSNEPYELHGKGVQYAIFDPKDYGYNFYADILFTSSKLIKERPKEVEAFYKASLKGWNYAYEHIDETIAIILKYYNTQNRTKEALEYEAKTLKELAFEKNTQFGDINPIRLQGITNTYSLLGLVNNSSKPNFDDFIYKIERESSYKKNQEALNKILINFYHQHVHAVRTFTVIVVLMILLIIYFSYRLKYLLKRKSVELDNSYDIFNKNISASRSDLAGNITYVTEAFCKETGYSQKELLGKNHRILKSDSVENLSKAQYKELWLTIKAGHTWRGEFKNINKDGSQNWASSVISPIFDYNKKIVGYESIKQDITIKKVLQEFNLKLEEEVQKKTIELTKNQHYLDTLFDINPNITYVLKEGKLERVNKAFLDFTGFDSLKEFLKERKCICELFEQNKNLSKHFILPQKHTEICSLNTHVTMINGSQEHIFTITTNKFTIENEDRFLVNLEDITSLERVATTDKLTGAYNRVKIDKEIASNEEYFKEYGENFSLIIIDIDLFKNVNDVYGHQVGDEVLKTLTQVVKSCLRTTDVFGRWGGEEFMIICPNTDMNGALSLAQSVRKKVQNHTFSRAKKITISAGVSDIETSIDVQSLIGNADKALYRAKENGRNRVET